jgi:hypothetical protein
MRTTFITLTRDPARGERLREDLAAFLGDAPDWELHVGDGTQYDLFTGYNQGAAQARFPRLCFLHDDVELLGNRRAFQPALKLLDKPLTGIVGVAGTRLLPENATWWQSPQEECRGMAGHPDPAGGIRWNVWPWGAGKFGPVVVTDGVFLMCRKEIWRKLGGFDAAYYGGFHFYDLDLSFRAHLAGLQNQVVPLPLLHLSHGETNAGWEENRQKFLLRHGKQLPARVS